MYEKVSQLIWKFFKKHNAESRVDIEVVRKVLMIMLLCLGGSAVLVILCAISFFQKYYLLCVIDIFVIISLLSVVIFLRKTLNIKVAGYITTVFFGLLFLFLIVFKGGDSSFFVWSFIFPLIALFLLGAHIGSLLSLLLLGGAGVAFTLGFLGLLPSPYQGEQIIRYVPTYVMILLLSFAMEKVGSDTRKSLRELNIELEKSYDLMKQQAVTDALTGIPNRHSFLEYIDAEFTLSQTEDTPISILMCDIDSFKLYNDTYGHSAGDDALVKIACAISAALPRSGDFCARYGGEEFIVVLPETISADACAVAETIRQSVAELGLPNEEAPAAPYVTISIGVATKGPDAYMSYEDLIRLADMALYRAKGGGRNRVEAVNVD